MRDRTLTYAVEQDGNTFRVVAPKFDVFLTVEGMNLPTRANVSFAAWIALPDAMRRGINLHLDAPIDPIVAVSIRPIRCASSGARSKVALLCRYWASITPLIVSCSSLTWSKRQILCCKI